ncbi:MAG: hypothetical protein ACLFTT_04265 [Candidatus Hydrogenedentota bacterium]
MKHISRMTNAPRKAQTANTQVSIMVVVLNAMADLLQELDPLLAEK